MRKSLTTFMLISILILAQASFAWAKTDTGSVDIVVDLTPPEVSIIGVMEGGTYGSAVIPVVSTHDNCGEVTVTGNLKRFGQAVAWVSGQEIAHHGSYLLTVIAVDRAGNKTERSISFTLNTAGIPTIKIDKKEYITSETMIVTVTDLNKTNQGSVEVTAYGIQGNPKIICSETNPGTFIGKHVVTGVLPGGFYVRYYYDASNKKYIEAAGRYVLNGGSNGSTTEPHEPPCELPTAELPGTIVGTVEGNEAQAPPGDTAFFKPGTNGYEYVPSIYNPVTGKYTILDKVGKYVMVTLPAPSNQGWVSPAKDWFENRGIAPPAGDYITTKDLIQVASRATGTNPGISGSTVVTPIQLERIINNIIEASPAQVNRVEINKWANDRCSQSKPPTKEEVIVTLYWFLQKANMAK